MARGRGGSGPRGDRGRTSKAGPRRESEQSNGSYGNRGRFSGSTTSGSSNFFISNGLAHIKPKGEFDRKKCSSSNSRKGEITHVDPIKCYGYIREQKSGQNIYFKLRFVVNCSEEDVVLNNGLSVRFDLPLNKDSDRAYLVYVGEVATVGEHGIVKRVEGENIVVDDGLGGTVKIHIEKLPRYLLPIKPGDCVSYVLAMSAGPASAITAKLLSFSSRSESEVFDFFEKAARILDTSAANQMIVEVLSSKLLWEFLGDFHPSDFIKYFISLSKFANLILESSRGQESLLVAAMSQILRTRTFVEFGIHSDINSNILTHSQISEHLMGTLDELIRLILKLTPHLFPLMQPIVDSLIERCKMSSVEKSFFKNVIDNLSTAGSLNPEHSAKSWRYLSSIPNDKELLGELMEADQSLPQVKVNEPYLTGSDYMDTNVRLLRAEIFSPIQRGIQDYKSGTLDQRDMNCYYNVFLAGYYFTHSQFCLALQFTPAKPVKNWSVCPQLMYGNLICISPNGKFDDIIWATVAERNEDILNNSCIIMVQLCKENDLKVSDVYDRLDVCGGQAVMVESPTYFNALHPALTALKETNIEEFSLYNEIVHAKISSLLTLNVENSKVISIASCLDESQKQAFFHCLKHRLAIIQGPPGTGKTFIGVKLVDALLALGSTGPYLVMTYKNHALDEFLKHLIEKKIVDQTQVVRIGGRSKEELLNGCNINEHCKLSKSFGQNIYEARLEIDDLKDKLKSLARNLAGSSGMTPEDILSSLTECQLISLINSRFSQHHRVVRAVQKFQTTYGSLTQLIEKASCDHFGAQDAETFFVNDLFGALLKWLPDRNQLKKLRSFHSQLLQKNASDDDHAFDEEDIRQMQEARMNLFQGNSNNKDRVKENLVLLNSDSDDRFRISDFPEMETDIAISDNANIGFFDDGEKFRFIHAKIVRQRQPQINDFEKILARLELALDSKKQIEEEKKLGILKKAKIVGMTISGGAIHRSLLKKLSPKTVIVEEAAEILEPSLISSLSSTATHLILIGDHKQLRPSVDSFELRKNCKFDVSMMERLVSCSFPFKALKKQSRMRPEFSALLMDIYPELEDNLSIVQKNDPLPFMEKSMFFWTHDFAEDGSNRGNNFGSRSKSNAKEADMVVALALLFLKRGIKPKDITILTAYLGQTKVLRQKLRQAIAKYYLSDEDPITVQTIDMYQGDENKYVIVSLVRSCVDSIGFLGTINRRCVAQSRSKSGLYFVGNADTLSKKRIQKTGKFVNTVWQPLIERMKDQDCVSSTIQTHCPDHPALSRHSLDSSQAMMIFLDEPVSFCKIRCNATMPCKIPEHNCAKSCSPKHEHIRCNQKVDDKFPSCGHPIKHPCWEELTTITCHTRISFTHDRCGHTGTKKCYVDKSKLVCSDDCMLSMDCCKHFCPKKCGPMHLHNKCEALEKFQFPNCGHTGEKLCYESIQDIKCTDDVKVTLSKCNHEMVKKCFQTEDDVECQQVCRFENDCKKHKCERKCGETHSHVKCDHPVQYSFPNCGHPSPRRKKCSEPITWKCTYINYFTHPICKHEARKECWQRPKEVVCHFKPCAKERECGHPCTNACGDDCNKGNCLPCELAYQNILAKFRHKAAMKIKEYTSRLQSDPNFGKFQKTELLKSGATAAEFQDVADKVLKYIQLMHNWFPTIKKIEKVTNFALEQKFEEAKKMAFGTHIASKFHGTGSEGVKNIPRTGFNMPGPPKHGQQPGMFGQGIYFATDSSKSAQDIYTKGSHKLLLCDVLIGASKTVDKADHSLCQTTLRSQRFDSVYAKRDSKSTGGVENDEYVIFDPHQAIVRYIIHYDMGDIVELSTKVMSLAKLAENLSQDSMLKNVKSTRAFDMDDPYDFHFRIAESHFMKMQKNLSSVGLKKIDSIDIVYNKALHKLFDKKKEEFKKKKILHQEVLAFHGTSKVKLKSILKENLLMKYIKRHAYGEGIYFSEFPNTSMQYGDCLILFRTLPGNEHNDNSSGEIPANCQSKKVGGNLEGFGDMLIIKDSSQFVPYAVYHLKN